MSVVAPSFPLTAGAARVSAQPALDLPGADAVEVVLTASRTGLSRYARSEITQNVVRNEVRAQVRVVIDHRVATAATNQLDPASMVATARRALEAARVSPVDEEFPGLATPQRDGRAKGIFRWDETTAGASPERRAQGVSDMLAVTHAKDAAGIFETSAHCFAVINSLGIDCFDAFTRCIATCLLHEGDATGWGEASSHSIIDVDREAAARTAASKAVRGHDPSEAEPGIYPVVLEPAAVALLLDYLSYVGMGAKQVLDGESFFATRGGEPVAAPTITIEDDVYDDHSVGIGFDFEGVPRRKVCIIDGGRAVGPVTDLRTAPKLGVAPSGHFSGWTEYGPGASNVVLHPGDASMEELIGGVTDGFLVTRFHYVNVLDRPATLMTGMTRDGTFRIRDGEIAEPVRNFRFTQSVLDALESTEAVGAEVAAFPPDFGSFGSFVAPALRVGRFNFASTTTH